jgi:hypothetical protein
VVNFDQLLAFCQEFKLSNKVSSLFADRGRRRRRLIHLIKPLIVKYATDTDGVFRTSWGGGVSPMQQAELGRLVHDLELRLLDHFEGGWATDWTLKRLLDQCVADAKRAAGGTKRKADEKQQSKGKRRKLVIYILLWIIKPLDI